jgi:hypothetical protein
MALAALASAAVIGGCSGASTSESTAPITAAPQSIQTAAARRHVPPRRPHPRHRAPAPAPGLPASRVSSSVVQPQPPADSCHARGSGLFSLPDSRCTPGAISPAVTQADIQSTICSSGYTETVRPPESITEPEKEASLAAYGDAGPLHDYEYDHLVPLELGGAPNDSRNLWPEPGGSPNPKDELENRLREMVCAGNPSLATAQREIAGDWVATYHRFVG